MNNISNEGGHAICEALCINSTLNVLFIPLNPITDETIDKLLSLYTQTLNKWRHPFNMHVLKNLNRLTMMVFIAKNMNGNNHFIILPFT